MTIIKMAVEENLINELKNEKVDDYAQGLTFQRLYRPSVRVKIRKRITFDSIENCIDVSQQGLEDHIRKIKEILITALVIKLQIGKQQKEEIEMKNETTVSIF